MILPPILPNFIPYKEKSVEVLTKGGKRSISARFDRQQICSTPATVGKTVDMMCQHFLNLLTEVLTKLLTAFPPMCVGLLALALPNSFHSIPYTVDAMIIFVRVAADNLAVVGTFILVILELPHRMRTRYRVYDDLNQ